MRIFTHILLIFISLTMCNNAPQKMDISFMVGCLVIAFISIIAYFSLKKKRQILSHSLLFTLAYSIVFYQFDIDYVLGLVDMSITTNKITVFNDAVVCKALCIANIALNSFYIGLCIREKHRYKPPKRLYYFKNYDQGLSLTSFGLFAIYLLTVNKQYLFNGYAKGFEQGYLAGLSMTLLQATIIAFIALRCYEIRRNKIQISDLNSFWKSLKHPIIFGLGATTLILMSGRRTEAVSILLCIFYAFTYVYKGKIHVIKLLITVVAISFFFTVLSFYRVSIGGNAQEAINAASNISSIFPPTRELAFNVSSLHIVLTYVPNPFNYNHGITFFPGFLTIIPGLQRIFYTTTNLPIIEQASAFFCTIMANGDLSWGWGTSCVADTYLSFGLIGTVILFILWGIYLGSLEDYSVSKIVNPFLLVLAICAYKEIIYISRGSLTQCFNAYTYSAILVFLSIKSRKYIR